MSGPFNIDPIVGDWYTSQGELFEIVAVDDDDGSIEVQYADGTVAEIDADDWNLRCQAGGLFTAEPPEDVSASMDVESDELPRHAGGDTYEEEAALRAGPLEGLDLFE